MMSIDKIKKEVRKVRSKSKRARYRKELVHSVVSHVTQGATINDIANETGLSHQTVWGWVNKKKGSKSIPIRRWPEKSESILRLYYPDGRWVEGLCFEDLERLSHAVSKKGA